MTDPPPQGHLNEPLGYYLDKNTQGNKEHNPNTHHIMFSRQQMLLDIIDVGKFSVADLKNKPKKIISKVEIKKMIRSAFFWECTTHFQKESSLLM